MAYTIRTKDGIIIDDVDDSVDPNSDEMKAVVARKREQRDAAAAPAPEPGFGERFKSNVSDVLSIPSELRSGAQRSLAATGRGIRQGAASLGLGDPEAARLAQLKVEQEEAGNPPSFTSDVGKAVTDVAPWMAGGALGIPALAGRGAAMLPQAAKYAGMIPKWMSSVAGGAAGGAAQAPFEPTSGEYDLGDKAETGALWGAATSPLGHLAGRLYAPFRNAGRGPTAIQNADRLNAEGLPNQIPATQTDDTMIQHMTNALEQIPWLGSAVKKARDVNLGWLTSKKTAGTGKAVSELSPSAREEMFNRLDAEGNAFRTQDPIVMSPVSAAAKQAADNVSTYAQATSQAGGTRPLRAAEKTLADRTVPMRPNLPAGVPAPPPPGVGMPGPTRTVPQIRTADEVMNLRNAASELAYNEKDPVLRAAYRDYKRSLEDKLRDVHGSDRFDDWLKQWGQMEEVTRAAGGGGEFLKRGKLTPERLAMNLEDSFRPGTEMDKLVAAARGNMPTPPPGSNRALATAILLGTGGAIAGGGALTNGGWGALPPATLGAALAAGLSRKAPSQAKLDAFRRMVMAGAIVNNPFNE
jgi:hypothetical protein